MGHKPHTVSGKAHVATTPLSVLILVGKTMIFKNTMKFLFKPFVSLLHDLSFLRKASTLALVTSHLSRQLQSKANCASLPNATSSHSFLHPASWGFNTLWQVTTCSTVTEAELPYHIRATASSWNPVHPTLNNCETGLSGPFQFTLRQW